MIVQSADFVKAHCNNPSVEFAQLAPRKDDQDVGVKQKSHRSGQRPEQHILREWLVEVIRHIWEYFIHTAFTQKFSTCLQAEPASRLMGNQIKDRLAVARDHYRLAFFNKLGKLG
jgi:hypothetical protein